MKWLIAFGIALLAIGLVLSLYTETDEILGETVREDQPYEEVGLVLLLGGIISVVAGGFQMSKGSESSSS
ncbi:MAG: hypothetical protein ACLFQ8_03480 [Candidatus Aenigmatarchaeota archaeon]